jgi:repressor LexA
LAFIQTYTTLHGVAPAEADMQRFFRVTAPAVHRMVLALEQRGLLERVPSESRSITLVLPLDEIPKLERRGNDGLPNKALQPTSRARGRTRKRKPTCAARS